MIFPSIFLAFTSSCLLADAAGSSSCSIDRTKPPGNLTLCGNNTLFDTWRPKARVIAPEGWMNDPMGMFQRSDGVLHAGYQCHPQHIQWGNISQCSAFSHDMVYWTDAHGWNKPDPKTIWPSEIYDIRGVFDGTVIKKGWNGYPTIIYTSTFTLPLGATSMPPEQEGTETQSLAYTTDGGNSWIKLNFGYGNNPVIYKWPAQNLTGFRDPYAFESPFLDKLVGNKSSDGSGSLFLTISSGIRVDADPNGGPRLWLYRLNKDGDVRYWTFLGPLVAQKAMASFSEWSGNFGINFETCSVSRLNEKGRSDDDGSDSTAYNIIGMGTEQGRNGSHENHWPIWLAGKFSASDNGSVSSSVDFVGVVDWGRSYAFVNFPYGKSREITIGWTYEDDENLVLTTQRGYQGAFTLFRDLFMLVTQNVDPSTPGLNGPGSWGVRNESDGSISVITVGQRVVPEITQAYRSSSKVTSEKPRTLNSAAGVVPFSKKPRGPHYAVTGKFTLKGSTSELPSAVGFRVLASDSEWTDVFYDPKNETVVVDRSHSTLISSYGNDMEYGKLRLWSVKGSSGGFTRQDLDLSIYVDGSIIEVYANDVTVITTRAYPWLSASVGVAYLVTDGSPNSNVSTSGVELWDGLLDAWPNRPADTSRPLLWDGPILSGLGGIWAGN